MKLDEIIEQGSDTPIRVSFRQPNKYTKKDVKEYIEIILSHIPTTDIIEILKNADPLHPTYYNITKEIALDLLTLNDFGHNRKLNEENIEYLQRVMNDGEFEGMNGETISFTKSWKLVNGQHRLLSIWLTGKPAFILLCTGLPETAAQKTDLSRGRSAADITSINGYQHNSNEIAYAVKLLIYYYQTGRVKSIISNREISNYEVSKFQENRKEMEYLIADLEFAKSKWHKLAPKFFSTPQYAVISYILHNLPGKTEEAIKFLNQFTSMEDLKPKSPILALRQLFEVGFAEHLKNRKRQKIPGGILALKFKYLFEAWNKVQANEKVEKLTIDVYSPIIPKPSFRI